jgi:hypothetical protein
VFNLGKPKTAGQWIGHVVLIFVALFQMYARSMCKVACVGWMAVSDERVVLALAQPLDAPMRLVGSN